MSGPDVSLDAIRQAAQIIAPYAHETPVLTSAYFDQLFGARLYFKCENLQKVGAFKFRGACNAVFNLSDHDAQRGVITHSSGNHAQALALAAKVRGIRATVVMPTSAPTVKRAAVEDYGATVVPCEPTLAAREASTAQLIAKTGATLIHPYNDENVIAGQGTAALELINQVSSLTLVLAPVGGGGLISGTGCAMSALCPQARVVGVEPEGADDAQRSLEQGVIVPSGNPKTIADGLLTSLGDKTFPMIRRYVSAIVTVSEAAIVEAMHTIWQRMKIIVEPSAAVPLAALFERKIQGAGQRIGIILTGGNVDMAKLPWQ